MHEALQAHETKPNNNKSAQSNLGTWPRRGTSAMGRTAIKGRGYVAYMYCIFEGYVRTLTYAILAYVNKK